MNVTHTAVGSGVLLERLKKRFNEDADDAYAIYDKMSPGEAREKMIGIVRGYEAAELIVIGEIESLSNSKINERRSSNEELSCGEKKSLYPRLSDDPIKALLGVADFIDGMRNSGAIIGRYPEGCSSAGQTASVVDLAWLYELDGIAFEARRVANGAPQSAA